MSTLGRVPRLLLGLGFWVPLAVCTYLALVPEPPDNPVFRASDVLLHGAAFTYLSFALVLAHGGAPGTGQLRAFGLMLGYGIALELVQSVVPERSAELKDLLVDAIGIAAGLMLARYLAVPVRGLVERLLGRL